MEVMIGFSFFAAIVFWLSCGGFSAFVAHSKGRSAFAWFVLGFLFGPAALLGAVGVAEYVGGPCPKCARLINLRARTCLYCKFPLRTGESS